MLEGFDSFYNDVNYDEVTKTQHAVMRGRRGAVQLERQRQRHITLVERLKSHTATSAALIMSQAKLA